MPQLDVTPFIQNLVARGWPQDEARHWANTIVAATMVYPAQKQHVVGTRVYTATVDINDGKLVLLAGVP